MENPKLDPVAQEARTRLQRVIEALGTYGATEALIEKFDEAYRTYAQHTGRFLPRVTQSFICALAYGSERRDVL